MTKERFRILNDLWTAGINAEILYNENPRNDKQMDYVIDNRVPFIIFIGENELKENKIKIKCLANSKELYFSRDTYIQDIQNLRQDKSLYIVEHKSKEINKSKK